MSTETNLAREPFPNGPQLPAARVSEDLPAVNSPEWDAMNERRAELIRKDLDEGLSVPEREEYERLQRISLAAATKAFPGWKPDCEGLAKLREDLRRAAEDRMTLPTLFTYSPEPHQRKHGPAGYRNYQDYKPWLRDEFAFRCVYCLERELWYPDRHASFSADHVEPQKDAPLRVCDYTNLVYACRRCNSYKVRVRLIDPTAVGFGMHLRVDEKTGVIYAIKVDGLPSREGELIIRQLQLNEDPALSNRLYVIEMLALKQEFPANERVHRLFLQTFGYPDDLPDLRGLQPPDGNRCEGSEHGCYRALRDGSCLPDTY